MQYNFKTQELQDKGVNFASIFPEKQSAVKEMTGFDFDLSNIVLFLKKETDNYQKTDNPLASELDKYIYSIYLKSAGLPKADKKEKTEEAPAEKTEEEQQSEWKEAVETLQMLKEIGGKKKEVAEWEEAIETLNMLLTN